MSVLLVSICCPRYKGQCHTCVCLWARTRLAWSQKQAPKAAAVDCQLLSCQALKHAGLLCTTHLNKGWSPQDSDLLKMALGTHPRCWDPSHRIQTGRVLLSTCSHFPCRVRGMRPRQAAYKGIERATSLSKRALGIGPASKRRGGRSGASPQLAPKARPLLPGAAAPALVPLSVPGSPAWMIKLIDWNAPAEQVCGGGGAAS